MRRIPIYVFLGPFLTWLVAVTVAALSQTDPVFDDDRMIIASLFASYGLTLLPLVLIAHLDRRLAGRPISHPLRILACTAAGFAWIVALQAGLALEGGHGELFWRSWPYVGLVGALPAALCSMLAGLYAAEG